MSASFLFPSCDRWDWAFRLRAVSCQMYMYHNKIRIAPRTSLAIIAKTTHCFGYFVSQLQHQRHCKISALCVAVALMGPCLSPGPFGQSVVGMFHASVGRSTVGDAMSGQAAASSSGSTGTAVERVLRLSATYRLI